MHILFYISGLYTIHVLNLKLKQKNNCDRTKTNKINNWFFDGYIIHIFLNLQATKDNR